MKHIVLTVTNDLVTDQRVDRSCRALVEAGYRVTLVGRLLPNSGSLGERKYAMHRMRLIFKRSALFYAEYNLRLFLRLMFAKADAFYANDTDTLLACAMAARLRNKKLLFDAHELFPEVPELVGRTKVQNVWKWVEKTCLPRVDAAFTVCGSVAEEYWRRYGVKMTVVRNLPEIGSGTELERSCSEGRVGEDLASNLMEKWHAEGLKILLYQGAVNVGRGVREVIDAMEWLPNCRLLVAGDGDVRAELQEYASTLAWHESVVFLGRVEPQVLHLLTRKADMGLCLLEDLGMNYRFSLPNRIADFAAAGVPILATDFVEIRRVIETYGTGNLTKPCPHEKQGDSYRFYVKELSETISDSLLYWSELSDEEKASRFAQAQKELTWDNEKKLLIDRINTILL